MVNFFIFKGEPVPPAKRSKKNVCRVHEFRKKRKKRKMADGNDWSGKAGEGP